MYGSPRQVVSGLSFGPRGATALTEEPRLSRSGPRSHGASAVPATAPATRCEGGLCSASSKGVSPDTTAIWDCHIHAFKTADWGGGAFSGSFWGSPSGQSHAVFGEVHFTFPSLSWIIQRRGRARPPRGSQKRQTKTCPKERNSCLSPSNISWPGWWTECFSVTLIVDCF